MSGAEPPSKTSTLNPDLRYDCCTHITHAEAAVAAEAEHLKRGKIDSAGMACF